MFEKLTSFKKHDLLFEFYRSKNTGLTVAVAQQQNTPLCHGFFSLSTEAHDDDGLPHTLEHLIFMGSKKYPFKGVLDLLSSRSVSKFSLLEFVCCAKWFV